MCLYDICLVIIVLLIFGVLIFCYLFFMLMFVVDMIVDEDDLFDYVIYLLVEIVVFLNFLLNLFFYCLWFRELRCKIG